MNKTTRELLETHFDTAFAAPDGIKKLRELILTLAMQGKLVAQDPNNPPASQLLKEIEKKARVMLDSRKVKYRDITETPDILAMQYAIPKTWAWAKFRDVVFFQEGPGIRNWQFTTQGVKLLNVSNILFSDRLELSNSDKYVSQEEFESKYRHFEIEDGDLLFAGSGASWGKVAWYKHPDFPVMLNTSTMRLKFFHEDFAANYLFYFIKSEFFKEQLSRQLVGLQPNFGSTHMCRIYIPIPPIAEQHRIVAKIDQLMARCDELEKLRDEREQKRRSVHTAALKQLLDAHAGGRFADAWQFITQHFGELYAVRENVTELRKAILQLGVQGKLVAHNGQSSDWKIRHLKELTTKIGSGSTPSGGKESYQEAGVPLIRSMNIHFGGFVHKGLVFLSEAQADKLKNVSVRTDDVLLNITGASIGRVAIAPEGMEGARVNQHVCIIRPTLEIIPRFLEAFLASPIVQSMIDDVQVGATREALTKSMIERFEILLPPLDEQHSIVAKIEQIMALCDTLEQQIDAATRKQTTLLDAVMAQV